MNYKVSDLSKILDISSNTVRRYEGMGYLSPDRMDANGYRVYGAEDVTKMIIINHYRKICFSHAEIAEFSRVIITKRLVCTRDVWLPLIRNWSI